MCLARRGRFVLTARIRHREVASTSGQPYALQSLRHSALDLRALRTGYGVMVYRHGGTGQDCGLSLQRQVTHAVSLHTLD